MQLAEKIVIITGAGKGIGRAIALTFVQEGVLFLATPQSRAIHGQALQVYGGVNYRLR